MCISLQTIAKCIIDFFFLDAFTAEDLELYLKRNPSPGSTSAGYNINFATQDPGQVQSNTDLVPSGNIE